MENQFTQDALHDPPLALKVLGHLRRPLATTSASVQGQEMLETGAPLWPSTPRPLAPPEDDSMGRTS